MNNILHWINSLSTNQSSFLGSVIGAVIGVIGAFSVGLLAIGLERQYQRSKRKKDLLRKYVSKLVELEIFLNQFISTQVKNVRLLRKCAELKTPGHFMMTLPRVMPLALTQEGDLVNKQLVNAVVSLEIAINLNNQLVEDFITSYQELSRFLMPILAQKQTDTLDRKMISEHYEKLLDFAGDVRKSSQALYERSLNVMSIVHLHGEKNEKHKFKKVKELLNFSLDEKSIDTKYKELLGVYSEKEMFKDV